MKEFFYLEVAKKIFYLPRYPICFSTHGYLGLLNRVGVSVLSGDNNTYPAPNTSEYKKLEGNITINGGEYSYVEGNVLQSVEYTVKTFKLTDAGYDDIGFEFLGVPTEDSIT